MEGSSLHRNLQQSTETICWYVDLMNIVFTFSCAVFFNCHHPLGFLKGEEFLD